MRRRFQLWGNRQKSKRGSLYDNMEGGGSPSKRELKKELSTKNFNENNVASGDSGDMERIKDLTTEEAVLKILKVQKELTKVKKRIQDRRSVQQIEIHNLQSRKTKLQHDLSLQMEGSPWTHAEYLAVLRDVFGDDEPFPSDKKFSDEAVKTLRQEHKCHLKTGIAKMVSEQNNADLMLVMGSGPDLKTEFEERAERIKSVTAQVTKENLELKNVLHYKEYIQDKMKNRMEIKITRRTSLSAAMTGLKNLELKTLQELADADSVDGSETDIPQPSKWNGYRNKPSSSGLASISDDEPLAEEDEDEEEDDIDSSNGLPLGNSLVEGSLDNHFQQNAESESMPAIENNEKSLKSRQRLKAQLARKQLEEKRRGRNASSSTHSSFGSVSSGSASGDSSNDKQEDTKDERSRRAEAARKRLEAKRRQNRLQKGTSSTSDETPTPPLQNEGSEKPIKSNGGAATENPMMSAAQKARLARQRRAEKLKEQNGSNSENNTAVAPAQSRLDSSVLQEGIDHSQRSRSAGIPPAAEVLKSPLWSVAKRAKDRAKEKKVVVPALPDLPDSPGEIPKETRRGSTGRRRAPTSKRLAERRKRIEERLERSSQHKRGSIDHASDLEEESDAKPLSFSQLAESKKPENFPTNTLTSMNLDTQARIRQTLNQSNPTPLANTNSNSFSELKNHDANNFPKNTLSSMNSDTQARIMGSLQAVQLPSHPRSGSLPSEKPVVSSAEQRALQAIADAQRRSSMTNIPPKGISSAEQRALQAIADARNGGSTPNHPPAGKRMSTAEQRALQAIADAQKGGGNPEPERRTSTAEQRALQAIADARNGGSTPNHPPAGKRMSSAEQRALQAIADAQKGGGNPEPERRTSTAEQRALQAIADAQKGGNGSNENHLTSASSENRAGSPREVGAPQRKRQTPDATRKTPGSRLTPSMRDKMTRTQSSRKVESDRVKEQQQRAQRARERLEEQRKLRQNRVKRNTANAEKGDDDTKSSGKGASVTADKTGARPTRPNRPTLATPAGARRNRTTGTTAASRQTAIERSRARRARMERAKSNDT